MKELKDIIEECNIGVDVIRENFKQEYETVYNDQIDWLKNVEDKTDGLSTNAKADVDFVISRIKAPGYQFTEEDSPKLSVFISQINGIVRIANRINNFKEGTKLESGEQLRLFELFNSIKEVERFLDLKLNLNKNLNAFLVHLFSVLKHCQYPERYPIYYRFWKNILGEVLKEKDDYDSLCSFYEKMESPKLLNLGAYLGTIGTIVAERVSKEGVIKEENDRNYKYIRNKILNIHYFDLISGYKSKPNYFIVGSKYGENNTVDIFPEMLKQSVISVGFAFHLDLSDIYLADEAEITEYLKNENESQYSINALKLLLSAKVGDRIAVKASGSPKGNKGFLSVIGICEVIQNDEGRVYNYAPEGLGHTISVRFLEAPICREYELGGYGSTMHYLSKPDHIELIFGNAESMSSFEKVRAQFDRATFDSFANSVRRVLNELQVKMSDERVVFSVREKSLNFTVGQRYCLNLFLADSRGRFGVISKAKLLDKSEPFSGSGTQPFYNFFDTCNLNSNQWSSVLEAIGEEFTRTTKSGFRRHNNLDFENYIFSVEQSPKTFPVNFPLNTILYGPPGTGKTFNTIFRAAEIIENKKINSYQEALKIFNDNLHDRIEFITFHQNYSYEDFIQGLRPETDNKSSLTFDKKDGVFKRISDKALENIRLSERKPEELSREALFDRALESFKDLIEEHDTNYSINETAYILEAEADAFRYTGDKWNGHPNGLRMKYSDLMEFYRNDVKSRKDIKFLSNISGLAIQHATYYFLVFEEIMKFLPEEIESPIEARKDNYVIVIDEINRANISRVFGELITLIEPDKRSHGDTPLEVKLPSGDHFVVPSNLYIIGTMNTADKSISLLDIALRRRFEFEPMYPLYKIEGSEIYDADILYKLNEQIIKLKGYDFQVGHAYFMGENNDLLQRMNKKVIPLLLEYFMNDFKEVKNILFNAGLQVEENSWPLRITGKRV